MLRVYYPRQTASVCAKISLGKENALFRKETEKGERKKRINTKDGLS